MNEFNIHIAGVGGQGIGLLSQALLRGVDHAGIRAIAVDTHGLAQRGGAVVSRIRCGEKVFSPLIMENQADLVLGMELHEAARGARDALKKGGTLVYLDLCWQPLLVRLGREAPMTAEKIEKTCRAFGAAAIQADAGWLEDPRMQNMVLLGAVAKNRLIPGVMPEHYVSALTDLLAGDMLKKNLAVFQACTAEQL